MSGAELLALLRPGLDPLERDTAVYWFLFLLFRFVLRRDTGSLGIADILLTAPALKAVNAREEGTRCRPGALSAPVPGAQTRTARSWSRSARTCAWLYFTPPN